MKQRPEHNDPHWCGRIVYPIAGLVLILVRPHDIVTVFTEHNFAFVGCVFIVIGLSNHITFRMKTRFQQALTEMLAAIDKENGSPARSSADGMGKGNENE